jgi:serine/threonine protein kinase, bacterial
MNILNNRYKIIKILGQGGFGETFLAEDTQMPSGRSCVVKKLKPIHQGTQVRQLVTDRFQREAAILEEVGSGSKQIPDLYAYLESEGQFYLIQEYIDGKTLDENIKNLGPFSEADTRKILVSLLPLLDYVHSKRIIHRDIKPENIILRSRDRSPVLIDFGAVKEIMGTALNSQGNTTSSIIIGTNGYMPNEQAAGRPIFSSDLYSLGLTIIYMLTGKTPHELETSPKTGEIVWHQHAFQVSNELKAVLDRSIAYHPRERYASASEMLNALSSPTNAQQKSSVVDTPVKPPAPPPHDDWSAPSTSQDWSTSQSSTPQASPPNASAKQSGNKLFLGALLALVLLGMAAVIAFLLNRQSQPVLISSTPAQSSDIATTEPTPSLESSSIATPDPSPSDLIAASEPLIPTPTLTPTPTTTVAIVSPSPANSVSPAASVASESGNGFYGLSSSPETVLNTYYERLQKNNHYQAWRMLPKKLQDDKTAHPYGYESYRSWHENLKSIVVNRQQTVSKNAQTAVIRVDTTNYLKEGSVRPISWEYTLQWDPADQAWEIAKVARK